jgi:outer membrane protein OmpA-like peptidoglycan-associated protein
MFIHQQSSFRCPAFCATVLMTILLSSLARGNVVGNGNQNFNTTPTGLDFVTVHSSETLKPGILNVGIFINGAVNSLPYIRGGNQNRETFNDYLLSGDLNFGLGLGANWDVGLSLPSTLYQSVSSDNNSQYGKFTSTGLTEMRLQTKYRLWGDDSRGFAAVGSVSRNLTKNNFYSGSDPGPTFNLELAADTTVQTWALGLNLGYRWLHSGPPIPDSPIQPMDDQIIASLAASHLIASLDTKIIFEIFGSRPAQSATEDVDRQNSSLEGLIGMKHDLSHNLALHAGGGAELFHGVSSPDWRLYVGMNYAFGPVFTPTQDISEPQQAYRLEQNKPLSINLMFEFNSDRPTSDSASALNKLASEVSPNSFNKLLVIGHTDSLGKADYNKALSLRRAEAVRRYLLEKWEINPNRIEALGRGAEEPIADNGNYQGRQQNRRVEFIVQK